MMEAWGERSPVIFVTGSSTLKRKGSGGFKEIDDVAIAEPLTKYSAEVPQGERIAEFVDRAWTIATSGYPGPVHLSVPVDLMFSSYDESVADTERPYFRELPLTMKAWPAPVDLRRIIGYLKDAGRPVLIGGHGVWWSHGEQLLERAGRELSIPVFNVPYHQKLLGEDNHAYMGLADVHQYPPAKPALQESDLVLLLGGRLDNQMNFGNPPLFPESTRLVCINGSHEELALNRAADLALLCDPAVFLESLLSDSESKASAAREQWYTLNRERRGAWVQSALDDIPGDAQLDGQIHPLQLALDVQQALSGNDWLIIDGGNTHFWAEMAVNIAGWQGQQLANILHPGTFSMLGVGVSFATAAKLQNPNDTVVLISGDGAFLSGGLSIEAAFQEQLPIVVVIDSNGGLDCISQQQERLFDSGKHFATDFRDIPFESMFEGLGGYGERVEKREEIVPAIQRAITSGKTACVNVRTKGHISPIVLATSDKRDKASIE
jgi:acetolactate synthase-1/2/3 large subunit